MVVVRLTRRFEQHFATLQAVLDSIYLLHARSVTFGVLMAIRLTVL